MSDGGVSQVTPIVDDLIERANDLLARATCASEDAEADVMPAGTCFQ
jgi:hypothetical protein